MTDQRITPFAQVRHPRSFCSGFTLVEAVIVIVVTGILAGVVAIFIAGPVGGYVDATRRAILTDMADHALRRMGRDLRSALPNSIRLSGTALEFIPVQDGARYRVERDIIGGEPSGNPLLFSGTATNLSISAVDIFGVAAPVAAANDFIVVFNTGQAGVNANCSSGGADAYQGCNRRKLSAAPSLSGMAFFNEYNSLLMFDSPGHRAHFVPKSGPVSYVCEGVGTVNGSGSGRLRRYQDYGWNPSQTIPGPGGGALLAENVSACQFNYMPGITQTNGLVTLHITLTRGQESVTLYHEIHVDNQP